MLRQLSGPEGNSTQGLLLSQWPWSSLHKTGSFGLLLLFVMLELCLEVVPVPRGENTEGVEED